MFIQSIANVLRLICVQRAAGVGEFEWERGPISRRYLWLMNQLNQLKLLTFAERTKVSKATGESYCNSRNSWIYRCLPSAGTIRFLVEVTTTGLFSRYTLGNNTNNNNQTNYGKIKKPNFGCFVFLECLSNDEILKSIWPLESSFNFLQNLSNRDFLAQFV